MARPAPHGPLESPSLSPPRAGGGYATAEAEFLAAVETYRTVQRRPFPTWSEILEIAQHLGYRKAPARATEYGASRSE